MPNFMQSVIKFAKNDENLKTYSKMRDYFFHYMSAVENKKIGDYDASVTLEDKERNMHEALLAEIERVSNTPRNDVEISVWAMSPQVKWATFAVVGAMIDAILPDTIVNSIGIYTDIETVGFGEVREFEVQPNSIFTVSDASNAVRKGFNKKEFAVNKSLSAVNHQITVETQLYKVLSGKESLARFVRKAIYAMETKMSVDAYNTLAGLVANASFPSALKVAGYTEDSLITLCQTVEAYNNGAKPVIFGTKVALNKVIPDVAKGYRMITDATNPQINIIRGYFDWDVVELPQVATGASDYSLLLDDKKIYVMSTGADKIIKGVIEGQTLTNTDGFYDNADLSQHATMNKRWAFASISNATMGVVTLP